jgi:hypothetical protein
MLCGELVNGGLASAGAVSVPRGSLGLWLPGLSPRPRTGSPYLPILAELLAAELWPQLQMDLEEQQLDNRGGPGELGLRYQEDVYEDVLLGELTFIILSGFLLAPSAQFALPLFPVITGPLHALSFFYTHEQIALGPSNAHDQTLFMFLLSYEYHPP